jgi:hypothetical protein
MGFMPHLVAFCTLLKYPADERLEDNFVHSRTRRRPRASCSAIEELHYIQRNRGFIPNYGERYRNGENQHWLRGIGSQSSQ